MAFDSLLVLVINLTFFSFLKSFWFYEKYSAYKIYCSTIVPSKRPYDYFKICNLIKMMACDTQEYNCLFYGERLIFCQSFQIFLIHWFVNFPLYFQHNFKICFIIVLFPIASLLVLVKCSCFLGFLKKCWFYQQKKM